MFNCGGFIIIDKPIDYSSSFISRICRKLLGVSKTGHLGTLDPFATGVLTVAFGYGTKAIPFIKINSKIYEFELKFGEKTNTADKTGEIIKTGRIPDLGEVYSVLPRFIGPQFQLPPAYSAIKVNGVRAYKLARKGNALELEKRAINITSLKCLGQTDDHIFKFCAEVSPGTYIRSLCEDIADALNIVGHAWSLRRIADGKFSIDNAICLDELKENRDNIESIMIPLENVLDDIPVIFVSCQDALDLSQGRCISREFSDNIDGLCLASSENGFLGMVLVSSDHIYPKRIFEFRKE
jgi:tRNA pseudouridine55 synthase